jgi:hypothetical protein
MDPTNKQEVLKKFVKNAETPASFSGVDKIYRELKRKGISDISRKDIRAFLKGEESYTLFKTVTSKFPRPRIFVNGQKKQYGADLADFSKYAGKNKKITFILFVIDMFSRKLWTAQLKSKSPKDVIKGFDSIFQQADPPSQAGTKWFTDSGQEFLGKTSLDYFKRKKMNHFTSKSSSHHNPIVERSIRTIKQKLYKYLTVNNTHKYLDVLPKIIDSYNRTWHRSIKSTPLSVNSSNEWEIWKNLYLKKRAGKKSVVNKNSHRFLYKPGETVLISYQRKPFTRSYDLQWSPEYFKIAGRSKRDGVPIYQLSDSSDKLITGQFYTQELQKVLPPSEDTLYQIDQVLRKRKRNGKTEYLVSWRYYPKTANSWVQEQDLMDLDTDLETQNLNTSVVQPVSADSDGPSANIISPPMVQADDNPEQVNANADIIVVAPSNTPGNKHPLAMGG